MRTRIVIGVAVLMSALMALCPPYEVFYAVGSGEDGRQVINVIRYETLWNDPTTKGLGESARFAYVLFSWQLGLVWAAAGAVILLIRKRKAS
jgi:hypothetical protein